MELDVGGLTGVAHSEKGVERLVERSGYCVELELTRSRGELCRKLGDDGGVKAAYRGGCRACQNLSARAIRLCRHLPTSSGFVSLRTSTIP